jgi:hypothetical protein
MDFYQKELIHPCFIDVFSVKSGKKGANHVKKHGKSLDSFQKPRKRRFFLMSHDFGKK